MAVAEPVTVRILEREYRVACTPAERRALMESALFVDQQMRDIRDSGRVSSMDKIAVMCALNLAEELLRLRQDLAERGEKIDRRIEDLVTQLDQIVGSE